MKFKIIAEDKKKGKIEIPVSFRELSSLMDVGFIICPNCRSCIKDNKIAKEFWKMFKISQLVIDIKYDGKCYTMEKSKDSIGRKVKSCGGSYVSKHKFYLIKKPVWKK